MRLRFSLFSLFLITLLASCAAEKDYLVTINTRFGPMKVILYEVTPEHKENFLELARSGAYDSTTFHRIVKDFMIQGGDVNAKDPEEDPIDYTVPAEFVDTLIHRKGALSAARMGDAQNPERASSGSQFYIVDGKKFTEEELNALTYNRKLTRQQKLFMKMLEKPEYRQLRQEMVELQRAGNYAEMQERIMNSDELIEKEFGRQPNYQLSARQKEVYTTVGGAPHLDGGYSVFGQVVEGLPVIDSIANVMTRPNPQMGGEESLPTEDVYMTMSVEEVKKKEMTKRYGIQYPEEE